MKPRNSSSRESGEKSSSSLSSTSESIGSNGFFDSLGMLRVLLTFGLRDISLISEALMFVDSFGFWMSCVVSS